MTKRLRWGGMVSRPFDMRCYRVMMNTGRTLDGKSAAAYERSLETALTGVIDLFDTDEDAFEQADAGELLRLTDTIMSWYHAAASAVKPSGAKNARMVKGDAILAMYAQLFKGLGILPDEIDRQDPELFFATLTETHISESDIPKGMGAFYGMD